jgi:OOP family OmpA-OmpF porin
MTMRFRPIVTAAGIALGNVSTSALAQDAHWYVGLGIGYLKTEDACPATPAPGVTCGDEDTTWKILGGYQLNTYLGVELGLVDMGKRTASLGALGTATAKFRIFELAVVGTMPVSQQFSVYAKAGMFQWDADFELGAGASG